MKTYAMCHDSNRGQWQSWRSRRIVCKLHKSIRTINPEGMDMSLIVSFPGTEQTTLAEVGGILQHGIVIAREYGKPCVVGVDGLMTKLHDRQMV
ncbi:MAG: PEP-utilizing enzyme, partial [Desulfobacterales bacterium]